MGRVLSKKGCIVSLASDGLEFLNTVQEASAARGGDSCDASSVNVPPAFDVVLMDRYMPRLEGPAATRWVGGWVGGWYVILFFDVFF